MENVKTVAARLKIARDHKEWKQAQLAAAHITGRCDQALKHAVKLAAEQVSDGGP